jgi:methionyl-tRNA synthetase
MTIMDKRFYITTPIYYVNDKPHIGHSYTTILADVLARYHRLQGIPTFFLTGTDEHGQKVLQAAGKAGITPQQQADDTVVRFQELWEKLEITNDDFLRSTEERHKTVVSQILQSIYDKGEIYRAEYDGWYCVTCERFFTEKDLVDGKCPVAGCGKPVERIAEANYFFKMSKYQDWLIQYINDNPKFIQPDFRRNETLGFLRNELNDLCISRPKSRLPWGIELPFDKDFVTYVWFDALINYISAIGYLDDNDKFESWWPASCQLIGKDILTTHTVYWPTMLKAAGLPLPKTVFAHGWWLAGDSKMSKSDGNVVNPMEFVDKYGVEPFRYFLLAEMVLGQDASFTEDAFIRRYNSDLANDLGNLLSRVVKMITSYCDGVIPEPGPEGADGEVLRSAALGSVQAMTEAVDNMRIDRGLAAVVSAVRECNRYLEKSQPWTLAKKGETEAVGTVLYFAAETLRIVSGMLYPVMPGKMASLRETLGVADVEPDPDKVGQWGVLKPGVSVGKLASLFPRIAVEKVPTAPAIVEKPEGIMQIGYDDFEKVELKTARIVEAEKVEGADKLLQLQIESGEETRQIVAGIAQHYEAGDLVGRTIVVVSNMKPAKIRGIESNGMLLAANSGDGALRLVSVDGEVPTGATVK